MPNRSAPAIVIPVLVAIVLCAPTSARADLRIHAEGAGAAPLDRILRATGPGFSVGGSIDYEVINLLAVGVFYSFNDFLRRGDVLDVYDHAVGARLDLRFVRHRTAGWFGNDQGHAYGEAFIELDLAYHNIGQESRVGWGLGMGYRVIVAGPFGLGPYFRFVHVVSDIKDDEGKPMHQLYATFGLTFFLSFDLTGGDEEEEGGGDDEDEGGGGDDEWSGFEPVSPDED